MLYSVWLGFASTMILIASDHAEVGGSIIKARALWNAWRISNYEFSYRNVIPLRIVVRDGVVTSATLWCWPSGTESDCQKWRKLWPKASDPEWLRGRALTIPQLFDRIEQAYSGNVPGTVIELEVDATYGYPVYYSFDITTAFDDEDYLWISEFSWSSP